MTEDAKLHAYADVERARAGVEKLLHPVAERLFDTSVAAECDFCALNEALEAYHRAVEELARETFHPAPLPQRVVPRSVRLVRQPPKLRLVKG